MPLLNPTGHKKIIIGAHQHQEIFLSDQKEGSREFSLEIILEGEGASCNVQGLLHGQKKDLKKWRLTQKFLGAHQKGQIHIRGVGEDESTLDIDARAILTSSSRSAQAHVQQHILLFQEAQALSLPVLTVETDLVEKASHSASVAPIAPEKIFYLRSRGFSEKQAQEIIKKGFLKF